MAPRSHHLPQGLQQKLHVVHPEKADPTSSRPNPPGHPPRLESVGELDRRVEPPCGPREYR
eukprot:3290247-Amphidinium_carterae.1